MRDKRGKGMSQIARIAYFRYDTDGKGKREQEKNYMEAAAISLPTSSSMIWRGLL